MYINLYLQYGVLMLSALSVVYVAARKLMLEVTKRKIVVLVLALLYNIPFARLGAWLYGRYGKMKSRPDHLLLLRRTPKLALSEIQEMQLQHLHICIMALEHLYPICGELITLRLVGRRCST